VAANPEPIYSSVDHRIFQLSATNVASRSGTSAYPAVAISNRNKRDSPANARRFHMNHDTMSAIAVTENRIPLARVVSHKMSASALQIASHQKRLFRSTCDYTFLP
jgi:hypothetical protein